MVVNFGTMFFETWKLRILSIKVIIAIIIVAENRLIQIYFSFGNDILEKDQISYNFLICIEYYVSLNYNF